MTEDEPRLVVAVDPAVEDDGGIFVTEVVDHAIKIVTTPQFEPGRALLVSDEFADMLKSVGDNAREVGKAVENAGSVAAWVAELFDVPPHILGIPYVVDPHIAGIRIKGGPFVPLKTGPRRDVSRAEWARTLRVHRALRRRARRRKAAPPTEQRRAPVGAVVTTVDNFSAKGRMSHFGVDDPRATAELLNRTMFS